MNMDDLAFAGAVEVARMIRQKHVSAAEVIDSTLSRIASLDHRLNAFSAVLSDSARAAAADADAAIRRGDDVGPLHGVPVGIKEQLNVTGARVSFGSRLLEGEVATTDAPVIQRLRAAGAIVVGMTTMPEFGWQGHSWSPLFGMTVNPWDTSRTAGGSSAGSASAIAAGMIPLAIGSDGAGSIRIPASYCGIFGLKPTYGRIAMYPVSVSELVTHYGPMSRNVRDSALMLDVMAGPDPRDPFCLPAPSENYLVACDRGVAGLQIGYNATLGYATPDPEVASIVRDAVAEFARLGCAVREIDIAMDDPIWTADQHLCAGAANRVWDRLAANRESMDPGFVAEVERLSTRTLFDSARARAQRLAVAATFAGVFEQCDILVTPTMADTAFGTDRSLRQYQPGIEWSPYTYPFNLTGQPAATVPCGYAADGLPVGMQIIGPRFQEGIVFAASAAFESARPWAGKRPPFS
jgi:aspartyl-tRNA(Asn)/glutamyl-tRNA(Gln) amidotransferase subunit A